MSNRVNIDIDGHVASVMLNRADKYNALDLEMFTAIGKAADSIAADKSIRAVVLHGAGENFCAGIDTAVFSDPDTRIDASAMAPLDPSPANLFQRAAYAWRELPVPVICAVQGIAFGGGLQIAAGADIRIAAPDARFSIMEARWGLIPDMAISTTLRHLVPADRIKELAWSARVFSAQQALDYGIVTALEEGPLAAAQALASDCAARSPGSIRGIKRLVNEAWQISEAEALALEARLQLKFMGSANQREAAAASFEKRAPCFED